MSGQDHPPPAAMAQTIGEGAQAAGADTTLVNTNGQRLDLDQYRRFDGVAFGTPDYWGYLAGGLKVFLHDWYIAGKSDRQGLENKPYGLFYSHGGGGAVRGPLEEFLAGWAGRLARPSSRTAGRTVPCWTPVASWGESLQMPPKRETVKSYSGQRGERARTLEENA